MAIQFGKKITTTETFTANLFFLNIWRHVSNRLDLFIIEQFHILSIKICSHVLDLKCYVKVKTHQRSSQKAANDMTLKKLLI